ncbi:MAG: hypothetical protein CR993_03370 [Rhodobacterales bacterium]|nr:MAG: hypothetical protein CR993_03370 [Rhodobacterales bacterium]
MSAVRESSKDTKADALSRILAAAEVEFAERGFDGAGMKALAARAGVSQSLLHYHFGSKDKLYAAVIKSRSSRINAQRLEMLAAVDTSSEDGLAQVFRAMFAPAFGPAGGGRAFARIFAGLIAGNERDKALVRAYYDETAKAFIAALQECLPGTSALDAAQIYQCALGVMAMRLPRDGRAERLAGSTSHEEERIETLVRFAVGGAKAIQSEANQQGG